MTTFHTTSVEDLAFRSRVREAAPDLYDALNHPLLNKLLGLIEDGTDQKAWAVAELWMDARDNALRLAGRPLPTHPETTHAHDR